MMSGHQRKTTGSQNYRLSVFHIQARDTTDHHQLFIGCVIVPWDQAPCRQLTDDDRWPLAGIAAQHSARCARRHTWDGFKFYLTDVSSLRMTGRLLSSRDWRQNKGQRGQQAQARTLEFGCSYLSSHQVHGGINGGHASRNARFWPSPTAALGSIATLLLCPSCIRFHPIGPNRGQSRHYRRVLPH